MCVVKNKLNDLNLIKDTILNENDKSLAYHSGSFALEFDCAE